MIKNKYINEAHKNEILLGLYKEEPLALQLYSWGWLQQQSCEDHEAYVQRLDRYAKILYKDKALVKIKLIDKEHKGYYGLPRTALEPLRVAKYYRPGLCHGMVVRQATVEEIIAVIDSRPGRPGGHINPRSYKKGFAHYPGMKKMGVGSYKTYIKDHKSNFVMVYWVALQEVLCHNVVDLITISIG